MAEKGLGIFANTGASKTMPLFLLQQFRSSVVRV